MAIVSGKSNKLVENILIMKKDSRNAGIFIKLSTIRYMKTATYKKINEQYIIEMIHLESVNEFIYLGSKINMI